MKKIATLFAAMMAVSAPTHAQTIDGPPPQLSPEYYDKWLNDFSDQNMDALARKPVVSIDLRRILPAGNQFSQNLSANDKSQITTRVMDTLKAYRPNDYEVLKASLNDFAITDEDFVISVVNQLSNNPYEAVRTIENDHGKLFLNMCFISNKAGAYTPAQLRENPALIAPYLIEVAVSVHDCRNDVSIVKVNDEFSYRPQAIIDAFEFIKDVEIPNEFVATTLLSRHFQFTAQGGAQMTAAALLSDASLSDLKHTPELLKYIGQEYLAVYKVYDDLRREQFDLEGATNYLVSLRSTPSVRAYASAIIGWADENLSNIKGMDELPSFSNFAWHINRAELDCAAQGKAYSVMRKDTCIETVSPPKP